MAVSPEGAGGPVPPEEKTGKSTTQKGAQPRTTETAPQPVDTSATTEALATPTPKETGTDNVVSAAPETTPSTDDSEAAARAQLEESMAALDITVGASTPSGGDEEAIVDESPTPEPDVQPIRTRRQRRISPPPTPTPTGGASVASGTPGTGGAKTGTTSGTGGAGTTTTRPTTTPPRIEPPPHPEPTEEILPARESIDRAVLDRGAEFFYQFLTGKKAKAGAAQEKLTKLGLCKGEGETFNASTRTLFAEAAYTKDKQADILALEKQLAKEKTPATRAHLESEIQKGKLELEHRLDAMKVAWLDRWKEDNKERNPSLTKNELENEAITYSARTIFLAATNFYPEHEAQRGECIAQTEQEKGLFRRYGEWINKQPRWKRIAVNAAVAGGIGGLMAAGGIGAIGAMGIPLAVGSRVGRSLFAGGLSAAVTSSFERFFGDKMDARAKKKKSAATKQLELEKAAANETRSREFETKLRLELAGKEGWLEDRAKALKVMSLVDKDARAFALERGECFADREKNIAAIGTKWRRNLAIGTGIAVGGGMALHSIDWDHVGTWCTGPKPSVPLHGSGTGGSSILERVRGAVCGWTAVPKPTIPELPDPLPIPDALEKNVLTIPHGGSVWSVGRHFIGDTIQGTEGPVKVTKEIFNEAWKNSTVDMVTSAGKHIKVPLSEVGLVHPGDQVSLTQEHGHWVFKVGDYVKDHFKVSNNAKYAEILQNNNIPLPRYLEHQTTPPATLIESATAPLRALRGAFGAHVPTGAAITPREIMPAHDMGMPVIESVQSTPTGLGIDLNSNNSLNVPPEARPPLGSLQSIPTGTSAGTTLENVMPAHGAGMPSETIQNMIPQTGMSAGVELGQEMSMIPESMFTPETHDAVITSFTSDNLLHQEQTLDLLSTQINQTQDMISTPGYSPDILQHMVTYNNELIDLQQELVSSPSYLEHISTFNSILESNDVAPEFYNNIENMRMSDFMRMSNRLPGSLRGTGTTESVFRIFYEDSVRLRNLFDDIHPYRREMRMTVGQFMKANLHYLQNNNPS